MAEEAPCLGAPLHAMKYAELQRLAKRYGIKANMKAEKLVKELEEYFASSLTAEKEAPHTASPTDNAAGVEGKGPRSESPNERAEDRGDAGGEERTARVDTPRDAGRVEPDTPRQEDGGKLTDEILQPCRLDFTNSMNEGAPQQQDKDVDGGIQGEFYDQNDAAMEGHKEATLGSARAESSGDARGGEGEKEEEACERIIGQAELASRESDDTVDMRELVMAELERRLKNRAPTAPTSAKRAPLSSKTPGTVPQAKNITPRTGGKDWSKIHALQFGKMESLNDFVDRKRKRREAMEFSAKMVKTTRTGLFSPDKVLLPEATGPHKKSRIPKRNAPLPGASKPASTLNTMAPRSTLFNTGANKTMGGGSTTPAAPSSGVRTAYSRKSMPISARRRSPRLQLLMAQKETKPGATVFQPITSVTKMVVRFSELPGGRCNNPRSGVKTPRRAAQAAQAAAPARESSACQGPAGCTQLDKTAVAPFRFDGICSPAGAKRNTVFDLQASLDKPLGYKPHKGKLKPWNVGDTKENSATSLPARAGYKQPKLQTRDDRRKKYEEDRKNRKEEASHARRGVALP